MTVTLKRTSVFDAPPDQLLAAATDPELLRKRVKPGTSAGTAVREVARDATRLVQELDSEDFARTKTGGLDRSRTERSVTRYEWDLVARHCAWSWRGGLDRVRLTGTIDIRASGSGAELTTRFEIEARIPLLGRVIERMMASEIEADLPRYEALFQAALAGP
jgi:hypothetical protein